jgi:hypothetical protein
MALITSFLVFASLKPVWSVDPASGITSGKTLNSVAVNQNGKVGFAVGEGGIILRWNGTNWSPDPDAGTATETTWLRGVTVNTAGTRAIAVGDGGRVFTWNGTAWRSEKQTPKLAQGRFLSAAAMNASGSEAWVVGQYGVALHWKGGRWTRVKTPIKPPGFVSGGAPVDAEGLYAVWMDPKTSHAIAAGFAGIVVRWDGKSWKYDQKLIDMRFSSDPFWGISTIQIDPTKKFGWMIGSDSILKLSNGVWKQTGHDQTWPRDNYLYSLASDDAGKTVFATGSDGAMFRYDGSKWVPDQEAKRESRGMDFMSICLTPRGDLGFAVGTRGAILRWDGVKWSRDPAASAKVNRSKLEGISIDRSGTRAMAVGFEGETLRWDGKIWTRTTAPANRRDYLSSVWLGPNGNAVATSNGGIFNLSGGRWQEVPELPAGLNFRSLAFSKDGKLGFAVAHPGFVYRFQNGAWSEDKQAKSLIGTTGLNSVALSADGSLGFIVGGNAFLRWDGNRWTKDPRLSKGYYSSVALSDDGKAGFATGGPGANDLLMNWDGLTWKSDPKINRKSMENGPNTVCVSANGKVALAAGYYSGVLVWNGTGWTKDPVASRLSAGQMLTSSCLDEFGRVGWILGESGFFLKYQSAP